MNKKKEILNLIDELNKARYAYYSENIELMSNFEYDEKYDKLEALEKETGIVLSSSPTVNVGAEVVDFLPKETHESPMLSLDKTKDPMALVAWLDGKEGLLSWKLDGLTVVLTYENGRLVKAVTRGNGQEGEVITQNAKMFQNLPLEIPCKGKVVLRGEAFIRYSDFKEINKNLPELDAKYKNPRNLCSGSVRQLNSQITKERNVNIKIFFVSSATNQDGRPVNFKNSAEYRMEWVKDQGFDIVSYVKVTPETVVEEVLNFEKQIANNDIPSDGLVLTYEDIEYGLGLGNTAKFPRHSIAFKWQDETAETTLLEIEWSPSRTGLINPVAIFEPVELEGTTVSRASVHNVSIMKELKLGIGDKIKVYKANMIIPQISENLTKSANVIVPDKCPVCGGETRLKREADVETLFCINENCPVKKIKSFSLFVSRDAMNIENISEATLEKFVEKGFIKEYADIFQLDRYRDEIVNMDGFGIKSYENILAATEKAKNTTAPRLLFGLGIPGIGSANGRLIAKHCNMDFDEIRNLSETELVAIDGIGDVMAKAFVSYFADEQMKVQVDNLLKLLNIEKPKSIISVGEENEKGPKDLTGITFVVTGNLNRFENRNVLKEYIQDLGGKVSGSVSSKTGYLINNDINSTSSKNKKANELGVPIISEEDFIEMFNITID